jgi:tetratricopeptide (TPR) repeat protein
MCELQHVPERKLHVMASPLPLLRRKNRASSGSVSALDNGGAIEIRPRQQMSIDDDSVDDAIARRRALIAGARHRRRELSKYVIGAVSASLGLCLAAGAKVTLVQLRHDSERDPPRVTARLAPVSSGEPNAVAPAPHSLAPRSSETNPPAPPPFASASAPAEAVPASAAPVVTHTPDKAAKGQGDSIHDALRLRELSRSALERGSLKSSIEAGEQSIDLNPTDSEAWLVLGAAYQQMGNVGEARRCFQSCLEKGKSESRSECAAMLR